MKSQESICFEVGAPDSFFFVGLATRIVYTLFDPDVATRSSLLYWNPTMKLGLEFTPYYVPNRGGFPQSS